MPRRSSILKDGETRAASRTRQRLHRSARGQGDEQQTYRGAGGASGRGVGAGQSTRLSGTEGTQRLLLLVLQHLCARACLCALLLRFSQNMMLRDVC